jgi:hypothetical protein
VNDLPVRIQHRGLRRRQVDLDLLVQGGQVVVRDAREQVVLDVVVHVEVQETENRVDIDRPGVHPVVQYILA